MHTDQAHEHQPDAQPKKGLNYLFAKFFLENTRLTVLLFGLLIFVGIFTTLNLKTTGFPSPEIGVVSVVTVYPGASSETIKEKVTIPLEGAIKNVEGVKRYNSQSTDSRSVVVVSIDEQANIDSVKSRIDSAVNAVSLPDTANKPFLVSPSVSLPDLYLAVVGKDETSLYNSYDKLNQALSGISSVASIEPISDYTQSVSIKADPVKLAQNGLSVQQIQAKVATVGESLPVVSDISIDGKKAGISTSIKSSSDQLEEIKNLEFTTTVGAPQTLKLKDLAKVEVVYKFENDQISNYSILKDGQEKVLPSVILQVRAVKNSDQALFIKNIQDEIGKLGDIEYVNREDFPNKYDSNKNFAIKAYAINDDNQDQVNEVIGGMIGSPIGDGPFANIGYLLGGIQLVFLVSLAFVSWRAAVISALAIPLSLVFSTIYLSLVGESLNTLTLFSLVLVIGLVVDPALVVLEAVQRKIDLGFTGKKAILESIKDVGAGVFMASLTNIIVFVPFGVLSGIFGQIFAYIPLTIIPAVIGSYIVPIVFLAWFGGMILKKGKNVKATEEENLWPIAQWFIDLNNKILHGSRWLRLVIILALFIIPVGSTAILFATGQVKQVDFATSDNGPYFEVSGAFLPTVPKQVQQDTIDEVTRIVASDKNVSGVFAQGNGLNYFAFMKPKSERDIKTNDLVRNLNEELQAKFGDKAPEGQKRFFDLQVTSAQTGGPVSAYQVSIAITSDDSELLKTSSLEVGKVLREQVCKDGREIVVKADCSEENRLFIKVDDGFTDKDNLVYDVSFDREGLIKSGLANTQGGPLTIGVNQLIATQFEFNRGEKIATIKYQGNDTDVIIEPAQEAPKTLLEINSRLAQTASRLNIPASTLAQVVSVEETKPKSNIQRFSGKTVALVQGRLSEKDQTDRGLSASATQAIVKYFTDNDGEKTKALGLDKGAIGEFSDGSGADFQKSFTELGIALVLAIFVSYLVLAVFFRSLSQPLGILYTIPLALFGALPGLVFFAGGQFGFLEIIGLIILVGIVENVAIFLIDSAYQKINDENWEDKKAISFASGIRFRPVVLTTINALASLAPLAIASEFYRSIAVVIMFGILSSGLISLITTPILFIFFRWMSYKWRHENALNKVLFFPLFPAYFIYWGIKDKPQKHAKAKV